MALPPISPGNDPLRTAEAIRSLAAEYNRADRFAPIYGTDTGTATAYAIAPVPGVTQYNAGQVFIFKATHANTGTTPTLNVNSLGAGTITNLDGSALAIGDIPLNGWVVALCTSTTPTFAIVTAFSFSSLLTTRGDLLVRGTNAPQRLALGTNGQALISNGTDAVWGSPIQVVKTETGAVATGTTLVPFDDTIPQNTEGDQYMSLSITPRSATSTLIITCTLNFALSTQDIVTFALFQDSTANALAATEFHTAFASVPYVVSLPHAMTSGTTSATTFKVRAGPNSGGTFTFNGTVGARKMGGVMASSIIIEEYV